MNCPTTNVRAAAAVLGCALVSASAACSLHLDDIDRQLLLKASDGGALSDLGDGAPTGGPDSSIDSRGDAAVANLDAASVPPTDAPFAEGGQGGEGGDSSVPRDAGSALVDAPSAMTGDAGCVRDSDCPVDPTQCQASSCSAGSCTRPVGYHFVASQFSVPGAPKPGLAGHRNGLIAAAYPYVFVVNAAGVSAFDVRNPASGAPRALRIDGLPSTPVVAVVAVGNVVYLVGQSMTVESGAYQPISWLDVSAAGTLSKDGDALVANPPSQVFIEPPLVPLQRPTKIDSLYNVQPNRPDGLFLVYYSSDHPTYYPTAVVNKPGLNTTAIPYWNQALVTGADVAVSSGPRLVAYTSDGPQPKFALIATPGTTTASVGSQVTVPTTSAAQAAFGASTDGGVLWTSAVMTGGLITAARLTLLLASRNTGSLAAISAVDPTTYVNLERYPDIAPTQVVVAPPVWISATLALGLAASHLNPLTKTAVHVIVVNASAGTILAQDDGVDLPSPPATLDIASSNSFAYALGADSTSETVYVLAPNCPFAN